MVKSRMDPTSKQAQKPKETNKHDLNKECKWYRKHDKRG